MNRNWIVSILLCFILLLTVLVGILPMPQTAKIWILCGLVGAGFGAYLVVSGGQSQAALPANAGAYLVPVITSTAVFLSAFTVSPSQLTAWLLLAVALIGSGVVISSQGHQTASTGFYALGGLMIAGLFVWFLLGQAGLDDDITTGLMNRNSQLAVDKNWDWVLSTESGEFPAKIQPYPHGFTVRYRYKSSSGTGGTVQMELRRTDEHGRLKGRFRKPGVGSTKPVSGEITLNTRRSDCASGYLSVRDRGEHRVSLHREGAVCLLPKQ